MTFKVAIVGAGPGGCMLARLLYRANVLVTVYEGEASVDFRSQGGTLDIRAHTGLLAIQEAGLWDEFQKHARYDGNSLLLCDKNRTTWMKTSPQKNGHRNFMDASEIDRAQLRKLLLESVPKEIIQWNRKVRSIDEDLTLRFDDGHVEKGYDLVVGADGAWSKIRNLVSQERPFYSGITGYQLAIPDAEQTAPETYKLINRGSVFVYSDGKMLAGQQLGDGSVHVSLWDRRDEQSIKEADVNPSTVKSTLLKDIQGWHPDLTNMLASCTSPVTPRNLYMLPVGFKWQHKRGVTLIGDAAHLMPPFAGIGVNMALHDALMLAHAIIDAAKEDGQEAWDSHIMKYEKELFVRAKEGQELTYGVMMDGLFTPGALRTSIESWVLRFATAEMHPFWKPLLYVVVYVGYFFYKLVV